MSKILAFNWKMNPSTQSQAYELFKSYKEPFEQLAEWKKIVFAPTVYLCSLLELCESENIKTEVGSQDVSEFESGAFTGQISAKMLASLSSGLHSILGCKYSLIGHSETRAAYKLTNHQIRDKIQKTLESGLKPILCVGYEPKTPLAGINSEIDFKEIQSQTVEALNQNIENFGSNEIIIAYEPTWAIGTGKIPSLETVEIVAECILETIKNHFGAHYMAQTRVLYGGSLNSQNIQNFAKSSKVSGFLIGGASLKSQSVADLIAQLEMTT